MPSNNITFILHKPQLSENIGACARGMKNFNFQKLSIIDPKPIFPNDKILATSVGAKNIINKSKICDNLESALRILKKKMQQEGLFKEMKLRRHYEKPSVKKKRVASEVLRRKRKIFRKY